MADAVFPTVYSTLSTSAIVTLLLSQYDLLPVQRCQFWRRGLSDVYWVETLGASYILRVSHHHWRSRTEILYEMELLDFLHRQGIPVAYPLRTKGGSLYTEVNAAEGVRFASLFIYAPGAVPIGDLNFTQSKTLGGTVAQMHQVATAFTPSVQRQPLDLDYLLYQSLDCLEKALSDYPEQRQFLKTSVARLAQQLAPLPKTSPYWGICWGDPHSGNAHFCADTELMLFDFDQCGPGWRAFEIGKFLQVAMTAGVNRKVRCAFLDGYQAIAPLEEIELVNLRSLTQAAYLWQWSIAVTYAQFHDYCRLDAHYFRHRIEVFKMLQGLDCHLF